MRRNHRKFALVAIAFTALAGSAVHADDTDALKDPMDQTASSMRDTDQMASDVSDKAGEVSDDASDAVDDAKSDIARSDSKTGTQVEEEYDTYDVEHSDGKAGQQAGTASNDMAPTSSQDVESVEHRGLSREVVGIKPQFGTLLYSGATNDTQSRAAYGFTVDGNTMAGTQLFLGPSVGLFYSHLGTSFGSNFFGSGDNGSGANALQIPMNLKVGVMAGDSVRLSAHGGANLTYRSFANSIDFASNQGTNSDWTIFPNVGGDIEIGGGGAALIIRPDLTLTPGKDLFTGTIGLNFPLG